MTLAISHGSIDNKKHDTLATPIEPFHLRPLSVVAELDAQPFRLLHYPLPSSHRLFFLAFFQRRYALSLQPPENTLTLRPHEIHDRKPRPDTLLARRGNNSVSAERKVQVSTMPQKSDRSLGLSSKSALLALQPRDAVRTLNRKIELGCILSFVHIPPRTHRPIRKPHHRIPQVDDRAPLLRLHPQPLALGIRL